MLQTYRRDPLAFQDDEVEAVSVAGGTRDASASSPNNITASSTACVWRHSLPTSDCDAISAQYVAMKWRWQPQLQIKNLEVACHGETESGGGLSYLDKLVRHFQLIQDQGIQTLVFLGDSVMVGWDDVS
jgi:hypothetical protein